MKKNYNCPATEVTALNVLVGLCQAVSYTENFGGQSISDDPANGR